MKMTGCPVCGEKHALAEIDLIPGLALGHFNESGVFEFDGETKVDWNGQEARDNPPWLYCRACESEFDLTGKILINGKTMKEANDHLARSKRCSRRTSKDSTH